MAQKNITLNAWQQEPINLHTVQGEAKSRTLNITGVDASGAPINLTGTTPRIYIEKSDQTKIFADGTLIDAPNGKMQFVLGYQALSYPGAAKCTIVAIWADGRTLKFTGLTLDVARNNLDNAAESTSEFSALVEALATVQDIENRVPKTTTIAGIDLQDNITLAELASAGVVKGVNLLHNWYFPNPVNQRGVSGTISTVGYFIDRWKLTSGSVTLTSNGLTLNGTITQILEYAVGTDVTASVSMYSGTATASYNNGTKTFTLTSSGGTIRAAKLEKSTVSTSANDAPPDFGTQLAICQRYTLAILGYARFRATRITVDYIEFFIPTPVTMRVNPTILQSQWLVNGLNGTQYFDFVFSMFSNTGNGVIIRATKTAHGLTDALINIHPDVSIAVFDANL